MCVLFEKWRYGFEILVQKPGYGVFLSNRGKTVICCISYYILLFAACHLQTLFHDDSS